MADGTLKRVLPLSHCDLVERALPAVLVTLLPSGRPQASVVWFDHRGDRLRVNSERGRLKVDNLERDCRATLIIVDPDDPYRYVEFRCDVESISATGALAHRAELDERYLGPAHRSDPADDAGERVIVSLRPVRTVVYG